MISRRAKTAGSEPEGRLGVSSTLGLHLEGVGLLLAIDPILHGAHGGQLAGQVLVPIIVSKREGILGVAIYKEPKNVNLLDQRDVVTA